MIAAPATTGPAQGPRPASSTPATVVQPSPKACRSKTQRSRSAFGVFGRFFGDGFDVGRDGRAGNGLTLLPNSGTLSDFSSQVVQLGPAHFSVADHVDLVDARRVQQEAALDPDTMSDPSDGKRLFGTATPAADHDAFEDLDSFAGALDYLGVHLDGVTGDQGRYVLPLGLSLQQVDDVGHGVQGYHPAARLPRLAVEQGGTAPARSVDDLAAASG